MLLSPRTERLFVLLPFRIVPYFWLFQFTFFLTLWPDRNLCSGQYFARSKYRSIICRFAAFASVRQWWRIHRKLALWPAAIVRPCLRIGARAASRLQTCRTKRKPTQKHASVHFCCLCWKRCYRRLWGRNWTSGHTLGAATTSLYHYCSWFAREVLGNLTFQDSESIAPWETAKHIGSQ